MKTLTLTEVQRHLADLIEAAPKSFEKSNDAAGFSTLCEKLSQLLTEQRTPKLPASLFREHLFPNASGESQRVLFANFRKTLGIAAGKSGKSLALIQPDLRGKDASAMICHFEGSPISTQPDLDDIALRAVAGLERQTLIQAPAAFLTGESLQRLVNHFKDPKTTARLPVRFFLSYAHRDSKLKDKLLSFLTDQLDTSSRFAFSIWQDKGILIGNEWHREIQTALTECDLCLSLLSPAFLTSTYIRKNEIPPIVAGEIPAIPIALEPLDFDRQNLHGLERFQISSPPFLHCTTTAAQKDFARSLARKIEEKVTAEAHAIARRFATDFLSGKRETQDFAARHPALLEILNACEVPPSTTPAAPMPAPEASSKHRFNSLLTVCLKSLPAHVITPYAATGNLDQITKQITDRASEDDATDPYSIFRLQQRNAVDHLAHWAQDPLGAPFAAVLGEIGSGKTTTLRMLAQRLAHDPTAPPVIFVDLKDYSNSATSTLEDILTDHLRRYDSGKILSVDELITSVRSERALIIYDGLDEKIIALSEEARRNFISELWRILPPEIMDQPTERGRGKLIISCRSHYFQSVQAMGSGYLGNDRAAVTGRDYLACVMLPWQDEQIRDYLSALLGPDQLETALDLIDTVHNLKDLASRPYLISLIGPELEELEKDRAAGRMVNAASLYRKFIERWLCRDDGKHIFRPAHKLRLMENLAATLWRENARTWPWERVEEWLETFLHENPVIKSALEKPSIGILHQDFRTATFFLRPDACAESFRFAHTSLQEYFLACHLARALENSDPSAWDLPEPSRETFDFLGQHLLTLTAGQRKKALASLTALLSDGGNPENSRLNALRYHLQASATKLPVPEEPALDCIGLDLESWQFHGTAEHPLVFGECNFGTAILLRTSFEHIRCAPGADFRAADLRSSCFYDCPLPSVDFRGSLLDGAFFRECDLTGILLDDRSLKVPVLTHFCPGSPWPIEPLPAPPSAIFAHGHVDTISCVAYSPDGMVILSGSYDMTLRLWDAASGRCIRSFSGHKDSVTSVAFSPDGKFILSGSHDKTLRLWDASSGECVRTHSEHENWVTSVAFSQDGKYILSGSWDMTLRLWDTASGKCIRSFSGHESWVTSVAFSQDGKLIISASYEHALRLWDVDSGKCILTFSGHENWNLSVAFSPDGKFILSGSCDKTLRLWDAASGKCIRSFPGHELPITSVAFTQDGEYILSGSWDMTLRLWDTASGKCIRSFSGHESWVTSVAFSQDGKFILSGSCDKTLRLWDTASGTCIRSFSGLKQGVSPGALSSDGNWIRSFGGHEGLTCSAAFSMDCRLILSGSKDNILRLWDAASGKCIRSFFGHKNSITSVAFSTNGELVLSGSWDETLRLWEAASSNCIRSFSGHRFPLRSVAFSPDSLLIVGKDMCQKILCWDLAGNSVPVPDDSDEWLERNPTVSGTRSLQVIGDAVFCLRENNSILREILPFPHGQPLIREPWNEVEARKPYHEIRWKFTHGPKDSWRWCHVVDPETGAIHPPELAAASGAFSGPEVGPV